jgi:hypothetical protein
MAFAYDDATHRYFQDGREVPACTRVLDHAGLVSYEMVRTEILERKSLIGTYVHLGAQFYDEGTLGLRKGLDWSSLDEKTRGRVEAWAAFRAETGFVPRLIEERFLAELNGMKYGLTVDREGMFRKQEAVIDLKTSAAFAHHWGLQLAGYAMGVPDFEGKVTSPFALFARRRRIAVQLFEDGRYKMHEFSSRRDADIFSAALAISWWKSEHGTPIRRIEE